MKITLSVIGILLTLSPALKTGIVDTVESVNDQVSTKRYTTGCVARWARFNVTAKVESRTCYVLAGTHLWIREDKLT